MKTPPIRNCRLLPRGYSSLGMSQISYANIFKLALIVRIRYVILTHSVQFVSLLDFLSVYHCYLYSVIVICTRLLLSDLVIVICTRLLLFVLGYCYVYSVIVICTRLLLFVLGYCYLPWLLLFVLGYCYLYSVIVI